MSHTACFAGFEEEGDQSEEYCDYEEGSASQC